MAKVNRAARDRAARESRKSQNVVSGRYYTDFELGHHAFARNDMRSLNWSPAMLAGYDRAARDWIEFQRQLETAKALGIKQMLEQA